MKRKSNRPFKVALNNILGPFHLIAYSSSDAFLAFEETTKLVNKFCNNGFQKSDVFNVIIHSLAINEWPGLKFNPSFLISLMR